MSSKPFGERAYSAWIQIQPISASGLDPSIQKARKEFDRLVTIAASRYSNPLEGTEYEHALPQWGPFSSKKIDLRGNERKQFQSAVIEMYEHAAMIRGVARVK